MMKRHKGGDSRACPRVLAVGSVCGASLCLIGAMGLLAVAAAAPPAYGQETTQETIMAAPQVTAPAYPSHGSDSLVLRTYWQKLREQTPYTSPNMSPYGGPPYGAYGPAPGAIAYPPTPGAPLGGPSGVYVPPAYTPAYTPPRPYPAPVPVPVPVLAAPPPLAAAPPHRAATPHRVETDPPGVPKKLEVGKKRIITNLEYWKNFYRAPIEVVTSPFRWTSDEWLRSAAIGGAIGGLLFADGAINDMMLRNQKQPWESLADGTEPLGNTKIQLMGYGAYYSLGLLLGHDKTQETALLGLQALAVSAIFSESIKRLAGRTRPDSEGASEWDWEGPGGEKSFVSGHTTLAFSAASVIAEQYGDTWYVPASAYTLATMTALSRVYDNDHWFTDVVAGAALGYGVGKIVTRLSPFNSSRQISLRPHVTGDQYGADLVMKF